MAKIMELPSESYESAMHLGRAMQFVNFIRDIDEDLWLGRNYFPKKEFIEYNLESLESKKTSRETQHPPEASYRHLQGTCYHNCFLKTGVMIDSFLY